MTFRPRWRGAVTLAVLAGLIVALLQAPAAVTAPGDLADLSVSKTDSPDPVFAGATLTYSIEVANLGPQGATGVMVTDRLPKQTSFVSAAASSGSCERKGRRVTCEVGDLAADPTRANAVKVTIQVRPAKAGTIVNEVSVESVEDDPVSANDKAEASTTVNPALPMSTCRGVPATIVGTRGPDPLVGTGGPDVIAGLGGNDEILGRAGRDLICSGSGNDRVIAGLAADRVFGGVGADRLRGRGGPDLLAGNPGHDLLVGNRGGDRMRGGRGFDLCFGGAGLDRERGCER